MIGNMSISLIERNKPSFQKKNKEFNLLDVASKRGDLVMFWDKGIPWKYYHLEMLWHGPFIIDDYLGIIIFYLATLDGERLPLPIGRYCH